MLQFVIPRLITVGNDATSLRPARHSRYNAVPYFTTGSGTVAVAGTAVV